MHFLLIAPLAAVAVEVTRKPSVRRGRSFALDPLNDNNEKMCRGLEREQEGVYRRVWSQGKKGGHAVIVL